MRRTDRPGAWRTGAGLALVVAALLSLAGCVSNSQLVEGSAVTVAVGESFTSANALTGYGSAVATNLSVVAATNSAFFAYDDELKLVADESFGTATVVSQEPFVVKYTIADGVRWSDGVPVDAADLLLSWAANSTTLNSADFDASDFLDDQTGQFTDDFPDDVVFFDGFTGGGLQLVTETPEVSDGSRSITLSFDRPFADWRLIFDVGLPAHVVAEQALTEKGKAIADPERAKAALIAAVDSRDAKALAALSRVWNSGFNFSETPSDPELLVSNGPYTISEIVADDHLVLSANPEYRGAHQPAIAEVTVRFIADPLQAIGELREGLVDIVGPQASQEVIAALGAIDGVAVDHGVDGSHEQLELQFSGGLSGAFVNPLVRAAFLHVVPRGEIVDTLIAPLQPGATPRDSFVFMPGQPGYDGARKGNGSAAFGTVDVAAATRLLAQAAASDPALASPTVCILYDPANPRRVAEFRLIQAAAAPAGFSVTDCSGPDWRGLLGSNGSYDAALYGLRSRNLSVTAVESGLRTGSALNNNHYSNPRVDELLDELTTSEQGKERRSILAEIDSILWADGYGVPLYQFPTITAASERVTAVSRSPFAATVLWNPWEWRPSEAE